MKKRAFSLAFHNLLEQKSQHTKMKFLTYSEFRLQSYFTLQNLNMQDMTRIFLFRTRMSQFWGNYRGNTGSSICTLCNSHPDIQEFFSCCYEIAKKFENSDKVIQNMYSESVDENSVMEVLKILEYREKRITEIG